MSAPNGSTGRADASRGDAVSSAGSAPLQARTEPRASSAMDGETARVDAYAFVPLPLRHDFKRGRDDRATDDSAREEDRAVAAARRTRSAALVATLLYGDNQQQHDEPPPARARAAGTRRSPPKPRRKRPPAEARTADAAPTAPRTPPLYALALELALSKRRAFDAAVAQLDAYFRGLHETVAQLEAAAETDATRAAPKWIADAAVKLPTMLQLQRKIVATVAACLPDCDVYLAMAEPLPMADPAAATPWPRLRFVAASPCSAMAGRVVLREQPLGDAPPLSFAVVDSLDPVLVRDVGATAAPRMRWFAPPDAGARTGPFACLPLVDATDSLGIGVLALDACRKAAALRPEAMSPQALHELLVRLQLRDAAVEFHRLQFGGRQLLQLSANDLQHRPAYRTITVQTKQRVLELAAALRSGVPLHLPRGEKPSFFCDDDDALALLDDVCQRAGTFLDTYRRTVHWHRVLAARTTDPRATVLDVYATLVHGAARALVGVERVCIWKIRDGTDIDAIAATQMPDDRLLPFLQWSERQIRRIPLYAECDDDHGRFVQGNVTRIHLPPPANDGVDDEHCARALYHVAWSNRTQQSLTWPQLRQVLPLRPMNARHYQLTQLLKKVQAISASGAQDDDYTCVQFRLRDPSALVVLLRDPHRPSDVVYALEIDFRAFPEGSPQQLAAASSADAVDRFVQRAVAITRESVAGVRGREARARRRHASSATTTRRFESLALTPSADALRALDEIVAFVFSEVSANLPGSQQQIAELQPDGTQLRFTFAGGGSSLTGTTLNRGQGVSFRCIDTRVPLIVGLDSELRPRLKRLGVPTQDAESGDLPYIFLPLLYEDACVGVLSVNRFVDVPKGRDDEAHPEDGVVEYLAALAKPLAAAIYLKRRAHAVYALQQERLEPLTSPEQLFFAACRVLRDVAAGAWKTRLVEIDFVRGKTTAVYDFSEAARVRAETAMARRAIPLGYRINELLPDTVQSHWRVSSQDVDALVDLWREQERENAAVERQLATVSRDDSASDMQRRKEWEWRVRQRYFRIQLQPLSGDAEQTRAVAASPSQPGNPLAAARATNQKYVDLALSTTLSSKSIAYADVPALSIAASSSVFIAVAVAPPYFAKCEQHFVNRVADALSRMMDALIQRVERSRRRVESLAVVEAECASFVEQAVASIDRPPAKPGGFPLTAVDELRVEASLGLLEAFVRVVSSALQCPNVYVALHEPSLRRLHYVAASPRSGMAGKKLHRGHGISFHALDKHQPLVATAGTVDQVERACGHDAKLRHFSPDPMATMKWPFVVVPIGSLGVLALDNLEKYERVAGETQPEIGLVDFLRRAAAFVGDAIASVRAKSSLARRQRREVALVRVMAACEDLGKRAAPLYVQHVVLQAIETAFNGVDAYIGMIQPLCSSIVFTSATTRSGMANQCVNASDSISFRVFLSQRPLVIPQLERKQFDVSETHAAKLVSQLRWFSPAQSQGRKGPFVCIPIPFVGVLSVDTFPGAASGVYSPQVPEHGVVDCLTTMANLLGASVRQMLAAEAARDVAKLFEGNRSTFRVVFSKLLERIARNVLAAVELCVVCFDADSWAPVYGPRSPLVRLETPVREHAADALVTLESNVLEAWRARGDGEERCFTVPSHPEVVVVQCLDTRDVDSDGDGGADWPRSCRQCKTAIVVRRIHGATWSYDVEFLQNLLPLVDELVTQVNLRVCGIAARRNAIRKLEELCADIENEASPAAAYADLPRFLSGALDIVTASASQVPGDAYVGERVIGGESLRFVAASESSLMRDVTIDLLAQENQNVVAVRCLDDQHRAIIHLRDGRSDKLVRPLTVKPAQRVFVAVPMSEDRVLCADSLSAEAFDVVHRKLERDVEAFLADCAALLEATVSNVRYRWCYDQLCSLKTRRHANFRVYYSRIHEILRRELGVLHSQQILELADDFTGQFTVRSWHRAASRRPIHGSVPAHFCFISGCECDQIVLDVHHEQRVALPMTNLPRTLDQCRASTEPVVGREKHGAYACDCLAAMLDAGMAASPKLALCVFSHDSEDREKRATTQKIGLPTRFTQRQRQFFFAFGAVAADVFVHVFRACVLETFSVETLFVARDRLNAKDAVLVALLPSDAAGVTVRVVASCSVPSTKWPPGSQVSSKLADKVARFLRSPPGDESSEFVVFMTRKPATTAAAATPPPVAARKTPAKTHDATGSSSSSSSSVAPSSGHSFFKRPRIFGGKHKHETAPRPVDSVASPPTILAPPPLPTVEFHVLLRGHRDNEVLSLRVEREIDGETDAAEALATEFRQLVNEATTAQKHFEANTRGDEEWNGCGLGNVPEIGEGSGFGGGGFHVLTAWTTCEKALQSEIVHFETDMRSYLTGVQATSREQLGALVTSAVRPGLLPLTTAATQVSVFSCDAPRVRAAALVLVRAALSLCGYKKEVAIDSPPEKDDDLLKEYLRANAGRKLLALNPTLVSRWPVVLRAANYLKTNVVKYFKYLQDNGKQRKQRVDARAMTVQCFSRCVQARKTLKRLRREFRAALAIQCAFRQHLARRRRLFLKWNHAAVTVQRAYRKKVATRRGRRPRKLSLELRQVTNQYGTLQASAAARAGDTSGGDGSAWKVEMEAFNSFKAYLESRVGREQLKHEEQIIAERLKEVVRHRDQHLEPHDRVLADIHDIFELLDVDGSSELSRERTRELMTRIHVPLSHEEADDVIDMMDDDRSGAISFAEFSRWFSHEFAVLKMRNHDCGVLLKRDRQWMVEASARSALRKRWRAHLLGVGSPPQAGEAAEPSHPPPPVAASQVDKGEDGEGKASVKERGEEEEEEEEEK